MEQHKYRGKPLERLEAHIIRVPEAGCWLWTGCVGHHGYGVLNVGHKSTLAHRYSWLVHFGAPADDICVLHRCDVRSCVNPAHLFLGTKLDNTRDQINKGRKPVFKGAAHGMAKLADADVLRIRGDTRVQQVIADEYGVTQVLIGLIKRGKIWRHLKSSS